MDFCFDIINRQDFWLAVHVVLFVSEKYYVHLRLQSDISDKYQSYKSKYARCRRFNEMTACPCGTEELTLPHSVRTDLEHFGVAIKFQGRNSIIYQSSRSGILGVK